jgi:hypothetical protein
MPPAAGRVETNGRHSCPAMVAGADISRVSEEKDGSELAPAAGSTPEADAPQSGRGTSASGRGTSTFSSGASAAGSGASAAGCDRPSTQRR